MRRTNFASRASKILLLASAIGFFGIALYQVSLGQTSGAWKVPYPEATFMLLATWMTGEGLAILGNRWRRSDEVIDEVSDKLMFVEAELNALSSHMGEPVCGKTDVNKAVVSMIELALKKGKPQISYTLFNDWLERPLEVGLVSKVAGIRELRRVRTQTDVASLEAALSSQRSEAVNTKAWLEPDRDTIWDIVLAGDEYAAIVFRLPGEWYAYVLNRNSRTLPIVRTFERLWNDDRAKSCLGDSVSNTLSLIRETFATPATLPERHTNLTHCYSEIRGAIGEGQATRVLEFISSDREQLPGLTDLNGSLEQQFSNRSLIEWRSVQIIEANTIPPRNESRFEDAWQTLRRLVSYDYELAVHLYTREQVNTWPRPTSFWLLQPADVLILLDRTPSGRRGNPTFVVVQNAYLARVFEQYHEAAFNAGISLVRGGMPSEEKYVEMKRRLNL